MAAYLQTHFISKIVIFDGSMIKSVPVALFVTTSGSHTGILALESSGILGVSPWPFPLSYPFTRLLTILPTLILLIICGASRSYYLHFTERSGRSHQIRKPSQDQGLVTHWPGWLYPKARACVRPLPDHLPQQRKLWVGFQHLITHLDIY